MKTERKKSVKGLSGRSARSWGLVFVFLLALGLRLAVFSQGRGIPQVETPVLDSRYYLEAGQAIASGEGLGPSPYFMSPGYIWFSALFHWFSKNPQQAMVLFQIFVDSLTCGLAVFLGFQLFGLAPGMAAGLFLALNGYQILSANRILPETMATLLLVILVIAFWRTQERPDFRRLTFSGALFGLLVLFRSNSLLLLPFLGLALWLSRKEAPFRTVAVRFFWCVLGAAVAILPVTLRNFVVGKDAVLISSGSGVNFYLGNVTEGDGRFISLNQLPLAPGSFDDDPTGNRFENSVQAYAERQKGSALKPSEVSAFWTGLAFKEISKSPFAWIKRIFRKIFLFFNAYEVPQVDNLYFLGRYIPLLDSPLAQISRIIWPLGLFGFLVLLFSSRRPPGLLLIFMGYALSVIFFFVTARHRLPAVPLVACLAGFAAVYLIRLLKFWNVRQVFTSFGLFSLCFAFTNLNPALGQRSASGAEKKNWFGVDDEYLDFASQHNNMAALLLERGDAKEAEQECRQGLALKPQHSTLLFNLARSFAGEERLSEAKTAAEQSLKNSPNNAIVFAFLGDLCYKTGDFAGARQALEAALRLAPSNAGAWNTLGPTLYKLGDSEGCIAALRRAEVLAPGWFEPAYNRGILLSHLGRYPEAITLFDSLHRNNAGNRPATLALAEALSGAKRFDQAGQLLNAFLAKAPNDTGGLLLLAEINLKQKKPKDARLLVLRVLTMNPNNTRALTFLQACKKMEARATVKN